MTQCYLSWESYKKNLSDGLSHFQQRDEFVDMTLAAEGHLVKVHRNLVALASPYLREMILSAPCQHPVVFLNNISHEILGYILEYIYTGEVKIPINKIDTVIDAGKALHIKGLESLFFSLPTNKENNKDKQQNKKEFCKDRSTNPSTAHVNTIEIINGTDHENVLPKPKRNIIKESLKGIIEEDTIVTQNQVCEDCNKVEKEYFQNEFVEFTNKVNQDKNDEHYCISDDDDTNCDNNVQGNDNGVVNLSDNQSNNSVTSQDHLKNKEVPLYNKETKNAIVNKHNHSNIKEKSYYDVVTLSDNKTNNKISTDLPSQIADMNFIELIDIEKDKAENVQISIKMPTIKIEPCVTDNNDSETDYCIKVNNAPPPVAAPNIQAETLSLNSVENLNLCDLLNEISTNTTEIPNLETLTDEEMEAASSNADKLTSTNKDIDLSVPSPLYMVMPAGSVQLVLNRYMYYCHHTSDRGRKRRWRCIEYRRAARCKAVVDTAGEKIISRKWLHSHEYHDNLIVKKGKRNVSVFTSWKEAQKAKIDLLSDYKKSDGVGTRLAKHV